MPYINIRLGCKLENSQRKKLNEKTTSLMSTIMGKRRELTVVHILESDSQQWATNATKLTAQEPIGVYVDIKITDGTNTPEEKFEMILQTIEMLKEVVGTLQKACYVVIHDIPADSWGYNGKTQEARTTSKA